MLAAGRHDRPEQGACFMEYASVLAGEVFSDQPSCTDPILAVACRAINDMTSDAGRTRLARHVPEVVGARCRDPRAAVVLACLDAAEVRVPGRFAVARERTRRRVGRLAGGAWTRAWARVSTPGCAMVACLDMFDAVRVVAGTAGDDGLYRMLLDILDAYWSFGPPHSCPHHDQCRSGPARDTGRSPDFSREQAPGRRRDRVAS